MTLVRDTRFFDDLEVLATQPSEDGLDFAIPEICSALKYAHEHQEVEPVFWGYQRLFEYMLGLGEDELAIVDRAQERLQGVSTSAAHITLREFLGMLTESGRVQLSKELTRLTNPETEIYEAAMLDFTQRMANAHILASTGEAPRDGDRRWDKVIWSQTQVQESPALIHFMVCHFTERYICQLLRQGRIEIVAGQEELADRISNGKDAVLEVLTHTILLRAALAEEPVCLADDMILEILGIWCTPKGEGGLGWMVGEQVTAYEQAAEEYWKRRDLRES